MARARIREVTTDLQTDDGAVLWSLVQGEQLEFELVLDFLTNAYGGNYTFEAVIIEGANTGTLDANDEEIIPNNVQPGGKEDTLFVRVPVELGDWNPSTAYSREHVVLYDEIYYKRNTGTAVVDADTPDVSTAWDEYVPNKVYVQFPMSLSLDWAVQPLPDIPVFGFFELRVTEPGSAVYSRTWKPMRGLIEFLFSPTELV